MGSPAGRGLGPLVVSPEAAGWLPPGLQSQQALTDPALGRTVFRIWLGGSVRSRVSRVNILPIDSYENKL